MWNAFSKLADANARHYNNHRTAHAMLIATAGVVAAVAGSKLLLCLTKEDPQNGSL